MLQYNTNIDICGTSVAVHARPNLFVNFEHVTTKKR